MRNSGIWGKCGIRQCQTLLLTLYRSYVDAKLISALGTENVRRCR